jgi:hypothetical protein
VLLYLFAFTSIVSAQDFTCPRSAEYTIYLKGENHINPEDIAFRTTVESLSQEKLFHYCVEGSLSQNYETFIYDPFQETPNARNPNTLLDLEDPLTLFLALLFTYRDFALLDPKYKEELRVASNEDKEQLRAALDYYDFRKNLIKLITTNSIGYSLWSKVANNDDIQHHSECKNLVLEITKYAHEVTLLQSNEIEPVCSNPMPLSTLGTSFSWAVLYTYLIQTLLEQAGTELTAKGVNIELLRRFLFYPRLETTTPSEAIQQATIYQALKDESIQHLRLDLRNKFFTDNLMHAFALAKDSRLPFIIILGNDHILPVYQSLRQEGYPVEIIFDNNRFLEKILGN